MSLKLYKRNGVWHYRGTVGPDERRARLRGSCKTKDKSIAARQVSEIEASYWKGHFDGPGAVLTFKAAAALYQNAGHGDSFLEPVAEYFKTRLVKFITPAMVRQMAMELFPDNTGASLNRRALVPAQAVINFAAESGLCSPIKIKRFKEEKKEKQPADLDWVKSFQRQAHDHLSAYALFMFLTGARPGEALAVEWQDVDLVKATVLIRETKGSKERRAHMPPLLVTDLANLTRLNDRPVFGYVKYKDMLGTWDSTIEAAGIKRLTPHCCRHGFATELLRRGVDVLTVAWLGGWANASQVLQTYGHAIRDRSLTNRLIDTDLTRAVVDVVESARKTGLT